MIGFAKQAAGSVKWQWGFVASVPAAAIAWYAVPVDGQPNAPVLATLLILLAIPWVIPGFVVTAVVSAPVYAWLRTFSFAPDVMSWLGVSVLIGAVFGCHVNAALAGTWISRKPPPPDQGLSEFLRRTNDDTSK